MDSIPLSFENMMEQVRYLFSKNLSLDYARSDYEVVNGVWHANINGDMLPADPIVALASFDVEEDKE